MTRFFIDDCRRCKILVINTLIVLILGLVLYVWSYRAINFAMIYPPSSGLVKAAWIWHVGARFMVMWYPLSFFLIHWRKRGTWVLTTYIVGCVVGMMVSFAFAIFLDVYSKTSTGVNGEYGNITKAYVVAGRPTDKLPFWIYYDEHNKCCTWPGLKYINLSGTVYEKEVFRTDSTLDFMKGLIDCHNKNPLFYNKMYFNNTTEITYNKFEDITDSFPAILRNCDAQRHRWVKVQHRVMFTSALFISFFGVASIVLHIHYHLLYVRHPFEWSMYEKIPVPEMVQVPKSDLTGPKIEAVPRPRPLPPPSTT